jgi:hypothetical protein
MTQLSREEFTRNTLLRFKEEEDPHEESRTRQYLVLWVIIGAVLALFVALLTDSPAAFLPAWGVLALLAWAVGSTVVEDKK